MLFSKIHVLGLGLSILAAFSVFAREPFDRPNLVLIFLDDSGFGDYEHHGNPVIETPNISRMASRGMNFTQFYVATAACSASRYALLTGRYPGRSGLGSWVIGPGSARYIHPKEITLAEGLRDCGYATGIFGKWHLGNPNKGNSMAKEALPLAHGFESWVGTNVSHDYANAKLITSDSEGTTPVEGYRELASNLPSNEKVSKSLTARYTNEVVRFIEKNHKRPFFAYVAHNQPHLGLFVDDSFRGVSRRGLLGDVMAELDSSVGEILKTIEKQGIAHNTLVVFTSDNGPWLRFRDQKTGKYGEARMHVGYAMPFRDGKGSTWEGGYRVPGIFYWPGVIEPTRQIEPASTLDLLPTVFRLAGADIPSDRSIDGRDIRRLLAPEQFSDQVKAFDFVYSYSRNDLCAIRRGPWKLMIKSGSQLKTDYGFKPSRQNPILFQVEQDLSERIDRAREYPGLVVEMLKVLEAKEAQIRSEGSFWDP